MLLNKYLLLPVALAVVRGLSVYGTPARPRIGETFCSHYYREVTYGETNNTVNATGFMARNFIDKKEVDNMTEYNSDGNTHDYILMLYKLQEQYEIKWTANDARLVCNKTVLSSGKYMIPFWSFDNLNETYKGRETRRQQVMDVWVYKEFGITLLSIGVSVDDPGHPLMWEYTVAGDILSYYFTDYSSRPSPKHFLPPPLCNT